MTEDEAKTKWCPFARTWTACNRADGSDVAATVNRGIDDGYTNCIGSACMAWKWGEQLVVDHQELTAEMKPSKENGYCGLAGKP